MPLHGQNESMREVEAQLTRLFATYRQELPDPETSPEFMPRLWEQIEARQSSNRLLKHWAQALVTAAAAASLLMGMFLAWPSNHVSPFYTNTYLELLASSEHDRESPDDIEIVRVEQAAYENTQ